MFLFIGEDKALLIDTGATEEEDIFPLYKTVNKIINDWSEKNGKVELIVAHTHKHGDHFAADGQFEGKTWKFLEMIPKDRSRIQDGKIGLVLFRQLSPGEDRYSSTSSCWVFRYRLDSSNITGSDDTIETQCR